jgi:hypothetical protein
MVRTFDYGRKKVFLYEVRVDRGASLRGGGHGGTFRS